MAHGEKGQDLVSRAPCDKPVKRPFDMRVVIERYSLLKKGAFSQNR